MADSTDEAQLLNAYLDDELSDAERAAVESALQASADLEAELADLAVVRAGLRELPEIEPPDGFFDAMLEKGTADPQARLDENVASLSSARTTRRRISASRVSSIIGAAAVVLLVLGFGSGLRAVELVPPIDELTSRHAAAVAAMPEMAEDADFHAMPLEDMSAMGPDSGATGMALMGAYESDDVVQLVYEDGHGGMISVFRQDGYVKRGDMPPADAMEMDGDDAWHLASGEDDVLIVDRDGVTYTMVGAVASGPAMVTLAADLPKPERGLYDRFESRARRVVDALGL